MNGIISTIFLNPPEEPSAVVPYSPHDVSTFSPVYPASPSEPFSRPTSPPPQEESLSTSPERNSTTAMTRSSSDSNQALFRNNSGGSKIGGRSGSRINTDPATVTVIGSSNTSRTNSGGDTRTNSGGASFALLRAKLGSTEEILNFSGEFENNNTSFLQGCSMIPSLLPDTRPADLSDHWPRFSPLPHFGRIYRFDFIPTGFFCRLMVRLFHVGANTKLFWRNGILLNLGTEVSLVELFTVNKEISIGVRGYTTSILGIVIDTIDALMTSWFQIKAHVFVPCAHCTEERMYDPFRFPLSLCENAARNGKPFVMCYGVRPIRIDTLVPDISMAGVQTAMIDYKQLIIKNKVGEGGFSTVYRAIFRDQVVALKKLKTAKFEGEEEEEATEAFRQFRREVWIMSGLDHENIVTMKGFCLDPWCLVTEYLPHGNLYDFLHNPKNELDWHLRLRISHDIAKGCAFLHNCSPPVIHRDLKSPNILLASTQLSSSVIAKVSDFGVSQVLVSTTAGRAVNNPIWLAPEVMRNEEYTEKADVYSFGVILWELTTRQDFFGEIEFFFDIQDRVVRGTRPPIPQECLPGFTELISECWHPEPASRPPFNRCSETIHTLIISNNFAIPDSFVLHKDSDPRLQSQSRVRRSTIYDAHFSGSDSSKWVYPIDSTPQLDYKRYTGSSFVYSIDVCYSLQSQQAQGLSLSQTQTDSLGFSSNSQPVTPKNLRQSKSGSENMNGNLASSSNDVPISSHGLSSGSIFGDAKGVSPRTPLTESRIGKRMKDALKSRRPSRNTTAFVDSRERRDTGNKNTLAQTAPGSLMPVLSSNTHCELDTISLSVHSMTQIGSHVWTGHSSGTICVWQAETGEYIDHWRDHQKNVFAIIWIGSNAWTGSFDHTIKIWNVEDFRNIKTIEGTTSSCMIKVEEMIWVGSSDQVVSIYDPKDYKVKKSVRLDAGPVGCMLYHSSCVWIGTDSLILRVSTVAPHKILGYCQGHEKRQMIHSLIGLTDHVWSSSSDKTIRVWDAQTGDSVKVLEGHTSRVFTLAAENDLYVWSGSWDRSLFVWNAQTLVFIKEHKGQHRDAISCSLVVEHSDHSQRVWCGSWDSVISVWLPQSPPIFTQSSTETESATPAPARSNSETS
eukprot:TRINITY_DN17723_c0_g1_i1.p1 TRINITY_DN17723_c0_g1~~TRINITY_DN17723_c0_g1_i1.p1  ORF type:complete len:1221 (-),score=174.69 TRINITY_DN17723_c0_g1_i1:174-3554(-)